VDLRSTVQAANREHEEAQAQALATRLHLGYVNLTDYPFNPQILHLIPLETIHTQFVVPYLRSGNELKVASPNPENPALAQFLQDFATANGYHVILTVCSQSSFLSAARAAELAPVEPQPVAPKTERANDTILEGFKDKTELASRLARVSTTELLDVLFAGALAMHATDIHIEPTEKALTIRFRVDGMLQEIATLTVEAYRLLRSRVKYLSGMKLDVHAAPQDGRFEQRSLGQKVDVRVSALPTPYGETFVLRLLTGGEAARLEELGFTPAQLQTIRAAIQKPNGLILNTGPTGSGKTTTLYAILAELNQPGRKIITIEDPIEYKVPGIQQTQVDAEAGYDFAGALRSVLRQDPDIVMVGEIRDAETATIAVQAAMTGHLVLSTLHTNSAPGAIPRLLDMGVKTYLLGGVLNLVIAQRLVRKLAHPEAQGDARYEGRVAIAELLVPDENLETLIQQKASIEQFEDAAHQSGMTSLFQDGLAKVAAGLTTEEEVRRVAADVASAPLAPSTAPSEPDTI
jgi:type II secretory ATPase GspE/PulE/Tfp pilus assembly ATPase PilB-like protein